MKFDYDAYLFGMKDAMDREAEEEMSHHHTWHGTVVLHIPVTVEYDDRNGYGQSDIEDMMIDQVCKDEWTNAYYYFDEIIDIEEEKQ